MKFAGKHPDRGVPYTPIAFLLDPAHGWEMTDYPQWPFGVSQINRSDRALRELLGAAYYPGPVREGEPASGERQTFVPGIFGNIFDVIVASEALRIPPVRRGVTTIVQSPKESSPPAVDDEMKYRQPLNAIDSYAAIVIGGRIEGPLTWTQKVTEYVEKGGVLVMNSAQAKPLSHLTGVWITGATAEADQAKCLAPGESKQNLSGQMFRYDRIQTRGAAVLMAAPNGDPLVTVNKIGRGEVILVALPDLLGEDERITPFAAHLIAHLAADATPIRVEGDVEYLVNRNSRGWVVTIFNDNGVFKPQQGLAQIDRSAVATAQLSLRGEKLSRAVDWISEKALNVTASQSISIKIPAGGIAIVELQTSR